MQPHTSISRRDLMKAGGALVVSFVFAVDARRASGHEPCETCGAKPSNTEKYCPGCGSPRAAAEARAVKTPGGPDHCPSCFAAVPPGLAACPVCGSAL